MKKSILIEELNSMKYLLGYKRGMVISEQVNPIDIIKQIQTAIITKLGPILGKSGPNKDGVDGVWGNITQTAVEKLLTPSQPVEAPKVETSKVETPVTPVTASSNAPDEDNSANPDIPTQ